jgi:tRNA threonylcarbamoyladenosine biosynthesis protein TsaB
MLHSFLRNVLERAQVPIGRLEGVAVAIGPGSFTGLRVGLAVAKGICWSQGIPLAGISSLMAIVHCQTGALDRLLAIKDAKRDEFYFAGFKRTNEEYDRTTPDSVGAPSEITNLVNQGYVPIGPGIRKLRDYAQFEGFSNNEQFDSMGLGGSIAMLGEKAIVSGKSLDLASSIPNYVRAPRTRI